MTVADDKVIDSIWIDRSIETNLSPNHDGFEVAMWVIFAILLVMAGVSVYYKAA